MNRDKFAVFAYWPQIATFMIITAAFIGYRYFAYYNTWSNDAYVSADIVNVAPVVSGLITKIYIKDNQAVKKGQALFQIDIRPFDYALQKATAHLKQARLNLADTKLNLIIAKQTLAREEDLLALIQAHAKRFRVLAQDKALSLIKLLDIETKIKEQETKVLIARQRLNLAQKRINTYALEQAQAEVAKATYDYNHALIRAPIAGYITNFNILPGQYVHSGQSLFALVDTSHWWVVTRYRETAIRLIKPHDKVKINLDMYPDKVFYGHVSSIGWGINRIQTGNVAPSTLEYLEPTEYWIKIAQRFPVRIDFDSIDSDFPLRIGASATTRTLNHG